MIDFQNSSFLKLTRATGTFDSLVAPVLINGEEIVDSYKTVRDGVVFTNKRIFVINVQGITGKKKDITSLPYSKIQAFSTNGRRGRCGSFRGKSHGKYPQGKTAERFWEKTDRIQREIPFSPFDRYCPAGAPHQRHGVLSEGY